MGEKKRVLVLGKNNISIECTNVLLKENRVQVVGCCPNNNDEGKDGWQKSFYTFCKEKDIKIFRFKKIRSENSLKILKSLNLDFIFSFQYDQIISQEVINIPRLGAINLHFSPLPKYRGVAPIAWALINGENEYGVTLHYMDPGIDTGDIISQTNFEIDSIKNARELYNKCEDDGKTLFTDSLVKLLYGNNQRIPQDNTKAIYYPNGSLNFDECEINFKKSTYMLYNWIRAFIFPPFQYPIFQYEEKWKKVVEAYPIYNKNKFEKPSSLVKRNNNQFVFSTQDCYIELKTE